MASASSSISTSRAAGAADSASCQATPLSSEKREMKAEDKKAAEMAVIFLDSLLGKSGSGHFDLKTKHAFFYTLVNGDVDTAKPLLTCSRVTEFPVTGEEGLGHVLRYKAGAGDHQSVQAIVDCERFKDIPADGEFSLAQAFISAMLKGHDKCAQALIASPRFKEIPISGEAGLDTALTAAAMNGHLSCVQALIASDRFKDLNALPAAALAKTKSHTAVVEVLVKAMAAAKVAKEGDCVIL